MPNRDHSGPRGEGALTGRRLGECNQNTATYQEASERPRLNQKSRPSWGRGRRQRNSRRRFN